MIRLGVDAWNLPDDRRGIGRYVRKTLDVLQRAYADRFAVTLVVPERPAFLAARRYHAEVAMNYPVRSRASVRSGVVDVMWFPFNGPSWETFPRPAVATLHDAHAFAATGAEGERRQLQRALARCDAVVTDSAFARDELSRALSVDAARFEVIHLGVTALPSGTPAFDPQTLAPYVLFVGETSRRKGIDTLVAAMRLVRARGRGLRLVLAGRVTDALPSLDGIDARVLGHVDDVTLGALYRACSAFVFPSRAEGFGLPILEAMLADAPVVCTTASSLPEVGGDAPLYVPVDDPAALAAGIERVISDPLAASAMRERGRARARTMTWERSTAALVDVFERVHRPGQG